MDKTSIRTFVKASKRNISPSERIASEKIIFDKIEQLPIFAASQHILLYHSLPDELPTHSTIDRWSKTKHIYLPRVEGNDLSILRYNPNNLTTGSFNITEPTGNDYVALDSIQLAIIPGIAFDCKGNRIGRGKGYYDRLLKDNNSYKIGVAFDCQFFDEVFDTQPHDISMDIIITPSYIIYNTCH